MSWAESLIKISNFEVEILQKRLAAIVERRAAAEVRLAVMCAEGEAEALRAQTDAEAGWYHLGFAQGLSERKRLAEAEIAAAATEELGARDALAEAFETLKKYEQVAENMRVAAVKDAAKREAAAFDELGLRRAAGGR